MLRFVQVFLYVYVKDLKTFQQEIGNGLEVFDDVIENSILHSKGRGKKEPRISMQCERKNFKSGIYRRNYYPIDNILFKL